jgi:hypothetical protein
MDSLERERNMMAEMFTKKMSLQTETLDMRRKRHKQELLNRSHRYQGEKLAKRLAEIENNNEKKRIIIDGRLSQSRLASSRRVEETKRSQANFEFVKRNLSPLIEDTAHQRFLEREARFADEVIESKKELNKSVELNELIDHGKRVDSIIKQREINDILNQTKAIPSDAYDPLKFKKNENNPFFIKQKEYKDNQAKSLKYADTVQAKIEQRSPVKAIIKWEEAQHNKNFGYFFKQDILKRKHHKLINWDPNSYMHESKEIGRRMKSLNNLTISQSEKNLSLIEKPKKQLTYKELLSQEVDQKKVNDKDLTNRKLNKYERIERAKKYLPETTPTITNNPVVIYADSMAEKAIRSRNPNVFKKYLNTIDYIERQAADKEKLENFEKKLGKKLPTTTKGDSLDLLSSCIKSKLKILSNT